MGKYYDGTKLLSMLDINGEKPEIYICTTNRTGGKTTYFNRLVVNRYLKTGAKFALLYRFSYEMEGCADKFFKDIKGLFFKDHAMTEEKASRGIYYELFLDGNHCGYAIALNNADQIKKVSHLLSDVDCIIFDEFQSETGKYCPNEIVKFQSLHTSIARGNGEQVRYCPVYMISNPVSLINPYYTALGISSRLRSDTRFLKGDGYVMEQGYVESAANAMKESGFNRAFANSKYLAYASENVYLNDNTAFIDKPKGKSRYICTLKYMDKEYAIREYDELGIAYVDDSVDESFNFRITVTTADHNINYVMLKSNDITLANLRYLFSHGSFRFKNLECKEAALAAMSLHK